MSKSPIEYLQHILIEIDFLHSESAKTNEDHFMRDELLQRACARSLEIIGEAAKQISPETKIAHPEIDWKGLTGLRDKLIHHYFGVDYALVWDVMAHELPQIRQNISNLLNELKTS